MTDEFESTCAARAAEFKAELSALLTKYQAEITAEDEWTGYAECGEDIHIRVSSNGVYALETGYTVSPFDLDLGKHFSP